jgi:hypothetical protein
MALMQMVRSRWKYLSTPPLGRNTGLHVEEFTFLEAIESRED